MELREGVSPRVPLDYCDRRMTRGIFSWMEMDVGEKEMGRREGPPSSRLQPFFRFLRDSACSPSPPTPILDDQQSIKA